MTLLLLTFLCFLIPAAVVGGIFYRWPQHDPLAPHVSQGDVDRHVAQHPRATGFLRSRLRPATSTGLALSGALFVIIAGALGVGLLLLMVHTHSGVARFDRSLSLFGAHHATATSTRVLRVITMLGGALVIVGVALVLGVIETIRQRTATVLLFLSLVVGGQFVVAQMVKTLVNRARPNFHHLTGFSGSSFPSGHAVAAAAGFAAFALVLGRGRTRPLRAVFGALAVGLAVAVAWTRVVLGVHWMTDVLAGLALGWAWFALCSLAFGGRQLRFGAPSTAVQQSPNSPRRGDGN